MNNLTERLLHAFITLDECRQFKEAAERCNMSQSALSQTIARLEEQLGIRLFDRDTRSVELTPAGEVFRAGVRRVLAEMDQARHDLSEYLDGREQAITFAALPSLTAYWVPQVMAEFCKSHPLVRIRLFDKGSAICLKMVREGIVDFALCSIPGNRLEFHSDLLLHEPFYVICSKEHRLAARRSVLLSDLVNEDFVHVARATDVRVHLNGMERPLRTLMQSVPVKETGLEVESLQTVVGLVANGFGISVLSEKALPQIQRETIRCIPFEKDAIQRPVYLVRQKSKVMSHSAMEFKDCLLKHQ